MSGKEKQSLKSRMFTHLLNAAVTAALRPKIVWEDRSLKKLAGSEPFIFVANHTHHFDGVFAAAAAKKFKPYSVVSRKWYDKAGYGKFIKLTKSIPIDLDSLDASWFQTGEKLISQGESILIFPEGAVAREGKMLGFKSGAGLLSAKTGARIIPIAIYGRYKMFFGKRQRAVVGKAIESDCPEHMRRSKFAKLLMEQSEQEVRRLYGALEKRYGRNGTYFEETFADKC